MAKAIHEFTGENPGELNFKAGDVIQVLRFVDDNWSEGRINDMCGIFPTAFVEIQPLVATKGKKRKTLETLDTNLITTETFKHFLL